MNYEIKITAEEDVFTAEIQLMGRPYIHTSLLSPWEAVRGLLMDIKGLHDELERVRPGYLGGVGVDTLQATRQFMEGEEK